jgi:hypothetical protein
VYICYEFHFTFLDGEEVLLGFFELLIDFVGISQLDDLLVDFELGALGFADNFELVVVDFEGIFEVA